MVEIACMKVFHRTRAGKQVQEHGFRDGSGSYMLAGITLTGVFFSDVPVDANEGAKGRDLLTFEVPDHIFEEFKIVEEDEEFRDSKRYREACIPADILNQCRPLEMFEDDDEE